MITYQDCPNCGARKIHSTVRLCEVCETWERAEQALNAQDEVLTAKYNQQLARAEKAERERDDAVEALESLEAAIIESLPYRYDDGTGDEADPGECIEYAAEEIAKLRKDVSRLQKMLDVCSSVHEHNVKLVSERDELRAEVERLQSWTPIGTYSIDVQHEEERLRITKERDEARAEVSRAEYERDDARAQATESKKAIEAALE